MVASETGNEAFDILLDWEKSKRDEGIASLSFLGCERDRLSPFLTAIDARHLLSLDSQQAATWIEELLLPSKVSSPSFPSPTNNQTDPPQPSTPNLSRADKSLSSPGWSTRATLDSRSVSPIPAYYRILAECARMPPLPIDIADELKWKRKKENKRLRRLARQNEPEKIVVRKVPPPSGSRVRLLLEGLPQRSTRAQVEARLLRFTPYHTGLKVHHLPESSYALFDVGIAQAPQLVSDLNKSKRKRRKLTCKILPEGKELEKPPTPDRRQVNPDIPFEPIQTCSRSNLSIRPPPQSEAPTKLETPSSEEGDPPLLTESNLSKFQLDFSARPRPLTVEADDHSFVTCNFGSSEAPVLRSGTPSILGQLLSSPAMSIDEDLATQANLSHCRSPLPPQISQPQSHATDAAANRDHGEGNLGDNLNQEEMKVDDELGFG